MSALPPKADIQTMIPGQAPADVRFAPRSGHKWLRRGMYAYDRNPTFMVLALFCEADVSRGMTASELNQVVRWFIDIIIGSREIFGYRRRGLGRTRRFVPQGKLCKTLCIV
jgi:hypothetical protein